MGRILTLTTDFGTKDAYVAAMKGTVLQTASNATLVDISHEVTAQGIMEAAFILSNAVPYFPPGTVHLVVVDPGVGTERRPIAVQIGDQQFVGADNGLLTLLMNENQPVKAVTLDNEALWRTPTPSATFHGRDIFAPAAAHLAAGTSLSELGSPLAPEDLETLRWAHPTTDPEGIRGWVVHIDHFGNCITNISRNLFETERKERCPKLYVGSAVIDGVQSTYGTVAKEDPLALFGSSGYLEIAINSGNAAELLSIKKGDPINIIFTSENA